MACKQCELTRVKGVVVKKCGARQGYIHEIVQTPAPIEFDCGDLTKEQEDFLSEHDLDDITETELLSELTDIEIEEAE